MKTPRNAFGLNMPPRKPEFSPGFPHASSDAARAVKARMELTPEQAAWVRKQKGW